LLNEEIVILPTDTLYGIAANAYVARAVFKVFAIKERDITKQLPVMYASLKQAQQDIVSTPLLEKLAANFWPGNLTIIVKKKETSRLQFVAETVAIRIPNNQSVLKLINILGSPITMPSANKNGVAPCCEFKKVRKALHINGMKDDKHIANQPSTIIDITSDEIKVIRKSNDEILNKLKKYAKIVE